MKCKGVKHKTKGGIKNILIFHIDECKYISEIPKDAWILNPSNITKETKPFIPKFTIKIK